MLKCGISKEQGGVSWLVSMCVYVCRFIAHTPRLQFAARTSTHESYLLEIPSIGNALFLSVLFLLHYFHQNTITYCSSTLQWYVCCVCRVFFQAACDVPAPEEKFNVDEYSDMVTLSKPVIYISIEEIINTHSVRPSICVL